MSTGFLSWSAGHASSLWLAGLGTAVALGLTVFVAPRLVARLPSDHFSRPAEPPGAMGPTRLAVLLARNVAGLAAALLGLVMLVTPGPGVVMLVVGLSLAEFPGKRNLVARLAGRPRVLDALNWLRRRHERPPFEPPGADADPPPGPPAGRAGAD